MANYGLPIVIEHDGFAGNMHDWAKRLGVTFQTVSRRYAQFKKGEISEEKMFAKGSNFENTTITHEGITDTLAGWGRRLGLASGGMWNRYDRFMKGEISKEKMMVPNDRKEVAKITHDGVTLTIREWADRIGVNYDTFRNRWKLFREGKMDENKLFHHGKLDMSRIKVEFGGKTYSVEGISRKLGITPALFYARLDCVNKHGTMAKERLFTKGVIPCNKRVLKKNKHYMVDGEMMSIDGIAAKFGIGRTAVVTRIRKLGLEGFIEWVKSPCKRYKGVTFVNGKKMDVHDLAAELGISIDGINSRIYNGWDLERAITTKGISPSESQKMGMESRIRNNHRRKMLKMGILV